MRKRMIFLALIWIAVAAVVSILYWIGGVSSVKDFISWALNVWPILAILGMGAIYLSTYIIEHDGKPKLKDKTRETDTVSVPVSTKVQPDKLKRQGKN